MMVSLRYIFNDNTYLEVTVMNDLVPILGILTGMIIPLSVFVWLYLSDKNKNETMIEMAKQIDDPEEIKELIRTLKSGDKPQKPIDYRRSGVMTLFAGIGLFLFWCFLSWNSSESCWSIGYRHWSWPNNCGLSLSEGKRGNQRGS